MIPGHWLLKESEARWLLIATRNKEAKKKQLYESKRRRTKYQLKKNYLKAPRAISFVSSNNSKLLLLDYHAEPIAPDARAGGLQVRFAGSYSTKFSPTGITSMAEFRDSASLNAPVHSKHIILRERDYI